MGMNQRTTRLGAISVERHDGLAAARELRGRGLEKSSRGGALSRVRMGKRCRKVDEDVVHQKPSAYRLKERLVKGKWVDNEVKEKELGRAGSSPHCEMACQRPSRTNGLQDPVGVVAGLVGTCWSSLRLLLLCRGHQSGSRRLPLTKGGQRQLSGARRAPNGL